MISLSFFIEKGEKGSKNGEKSRMSYTFVTKK